MSKTARHPAGLLPASCGTPIHDLKLRVTIDRAFNIVAADAASDAVPYPGMCNTIAPAYQALVGLNLMQHFRLHLKHASMACSAVPT